MKLQGWLKLAGFSLGAFASAKAVSSFLPERFPSLDRPVSQIISQPIVAERSNWPEIDVSFLRCGTIQVPEAIAIRGGSLLKTRTNTLGAVLIRHPRGTFLYDTGLSTTLNRYLPDTPFLFRHTLAAFDFEQSLQSHLRFRGLQPRDLDFALISHLHWDHVGGVPDLPGVKLLVNQVEYAAWQARSGSLKKTFELIENLLDDNPIEQFRCEGPNYEGFRSSYDLFGDGSVVLVPLPGHTPGNTGMFINRSNGSRLFLLGDAVWCSQNYQYPATMHPLIWREVTSDDATARQTLLDLHHFALQHPEISMIAMHDAEVQDRWMAVENGEVRSLLPGNSR